VKSHVTPRARLHPDRSGDPLDGLVNLFDLGIVLSVAFLLAALSSLNLTSLLGNKDVTVISNPGTPQQAVIVKEGTQVRVVKLGEKQVEGKGVRVGSVYRLSNGQIVVVREDQSSAP
jgi:hypothetical protein